MYILDAGRLNKRISIYGYQDVENALGESRTVLTKKATVHAEIHPVRGQEFLEYYREANKLQLKITIRFPKTFKVTEDDVIIRADGTQYEVNSIIDVNDEHVALEIYCTERKKKLLEVET